VGAAAAANIKPCTLELGGKSPVIVCPDVDVDKVGGGGLEVCVICGGGAGVLVCSDVDMDKVVVVVVVGGWRGLAAGLLPAAACSGWVLLLCTWVSWLWAGGGLLGPAVGGCGIAGAGRCLQCVTAASAYPAVADPACCCQLPLLTPP
jgi:hypothetical protein